MEIDMNIIVVGAGKIGSTIISRLVEEEHDLTVIDNDPSVIANITNIYDVMGVIGNGTDCSVLQEAGVGEAELIIAATSSDELNMLCCFLARKLGSKHTIARIRNPEYNLESLGFLKQHLGLSMAINPEMLAAREMYNVFKLPSAAKIETFSQTNLEIVEIILREGSPMTGVPLMNIRSRFKAKFLVCVVQRGNEVYIPSGSFVLAPGDKIGLTAAPAEILKLMRSLGQDLRQSKNIMILGGGRLGFYLSKLLEGAGCSVKIVERNPEKCVELSKKLSKAIVIHGDGAQQELLMEEGLDNLDAFVALTGMDEENILLSMLASAHKVPKVIAKVNRDELSDMAEKLGLDSVISPRKVVSDRVVQYARALENSLGSSVETLYNIMDGKAEVLEFVVGADFSHCGIPLKTLQLRDNILIAGIIRDRKPILPTGDDKIMQNDRVIVVASDRRLGDLSDIVK